MGITNYYYGSAVVSHLEESPPRYEVLSDDRSPAERDEVGERPRTFDDKEQRIAELLEYGRGVANCETLAEAISACKNRDHATYVKHHEEKAEAAQKRLEDKREAVKQQRKEVATSEPNAIDLPSTPKSDPDADTELLEADDE